MKALVVGCGSIGKRHIRNLCKVREIDYIYVFSSIKNCAKEFTGAGKTVEQVSSIDNTDADIALICNNTSRHIESALVLAGQGIDLFIEKPLSHNLKNIDKLRTLARKNKIKTFLAYNMRFLGAIELVKKTVKSGAIGRLFFSRIEAGQYLPSWRPGTDYRKSYSASSSLGGGVDLDLSHEIDYMRYIFGEPRNWQVVKAKVSKLEISSNDIFEGIYTYNNGPVTSVHLDYLAVRPNRKLLITGEKGAIECDFIAKTIKIKGKVYKNRTLFDMPLTYEKELNHFIKAVKSNGKLLTTLDDGIAALKLIGAKNV